MAHDCSKEGCTPGLSGGTLHVLDAEHGIFSVQSTFSGPAPAEAPIEFVGPAIASGVWRVEPSGPAGTWVPVFAWKDVDADKILEAFEPGPVEVCDLVSALAVKARSSFSVNEKWAQRIQALESAFEVVALKDAASKVAATPRVEWLARLEALEKRLDELPKASLGRPIVQEAPEKSKATPVSEQLAVLRASRERLSLDRHKAPRARARRPWALYVAIALTAAACGSLAWLAATRCQPPGAWIEGMGRP